MSDEEKREETPVVLARGQQRDESWQEFEDRVIAQFRAAGLLKSRKGPRPQPDTEDAPPS